MYQFTTTTIVNSALDSDGVTAKFGGAADKLFVSRVGTFLKTGIVSVYKNIYKAGVKEVAQVTVPTITAKKVIRVTVDIALERQADSEYANFSQFFRKPVTVEVLATGTAGTDAAALKDQLNALKDRFGFKYVVATVSGANLIITATNFNQRIKDIKIESEAAGTNTIVQPEYDNVGVSFTVTTAGKIGFGDDDWMARAIFLPTAENVRYFGMNKEERPILGGNYTQYTLRYSIAKEGQDGIVAGGTSITTHVFYVLSSLVSAFEVELAKVTNLVYTLTLTVPDDSLANEATTQVIVANAIGKVTYSVVSGTSATISATGLVTAHATTDGETVIKATDSTGNFAVHTITVA